jgi:hypothetical protein
MWTDTLRNLAEIAVALSAIIGFCALATRLRPVKWVFRHLVSDPVQGWFRSTVREEVDDAIAPIKAELMFNGGSSLKDQVTRLVKLAEKQ